MDTLTYVVITIEALVSALTALAYALNGHRYRVPELLLWAASDAAVLWLLFELPGDLSTPHKWLAAWYAFAFGVNAVSALRGGKVVKAERSMPAAAGFIMALLLAAQLGLLFAGA